MDGNIKDSLPLKNEGDDLLHELYYTKDLLKFIISDLTCSLLFCSIHEPASKEDEWNAEQLSHIQCHILFEIHLFLLEKLHKETEDEDSGQAEAKIKSCPDRHRRLFSHRLRLVPPVVNHDSCKPYDEVGYSLIQLRSMTGNSLSIDKRLSAMENECPSHICCLTNNL